MCIHIRNTWCSATAKCSLKMPKECHSSTRVLEYTLIDTHHARVLEYILIPTMHARSAQETLTEFKGLVFFHVILLFSVYQNIPSSPLYVHWASQLKLVQSPKTMPKYKYLTKHRHRYNRKNWQIWPYDTTSLYTVTIVMKIEWAPSLLLSS